MNQKIILSLACIQFVIITSTCFAQDATIPIPHNKIVLEDMKTYKPEIYSQYRTGIMKEISGIVVGAAGVGFIAMGGLCMIMPEGGSSYVSMGPFRVESDNGNLKKVGPVLMAIGAVGLGVGIPLMISGGNKRKQILENFKSQHYSSPNSSAYFQMNLYSNGVGIAYVF